MPGSTARQAKYRVGNPPKSAVAGAPRICVGVRTLAKIVCGLRPLLFDKFTNLPILQETIQRARRCSSAASRISQRRLLKATTFWRSSKKGT